MSKKPYYRDFEDFFQRDFLVDHSNKWNMRLHFLGVHLFTISFLIGLFTFSPLYLLLSPFGFIIPSVTGHWIFQKNEVLSENDEGYRHWAISAPFAMVYRFYTGSFSLP